MAYPNYPSYYPNFNQPQQSILWCQGIEGAKAYPVGAGNSVLLMDSDSHNMYIKSADQAGVPSLRIFEYTEVTGKKEEAPKIDTSNFVTREELEEALAKLKPKKKKLIEVEDDE